MRLALIAAALFLAAPAIAQTKTEFPQKLDRADFQGVIANAGSVYVAGQPTEAALRDMAAHGVTVDDPYQWLEGSGAAFTGSGSNTLVNIGTIKPASGSRLGAALTGIDVPTLRDVWATAPYLHDGSAAALGDAVQAHSGVTIDTTGLASLVAYLQ